MELTPWEATNCSAIDEFPNILWNPNVHYRVHRSPPVVPNPSQINPVHITRSYFSNIPFNNTVTMCVTIDGVWIGEWIYWPLVYTTRNYTLQTTDTYISVLSLLQSPLAVSWQRLLPREILQLPALRFPCHSRPCRTLYQLTTQLTGSQAGGYFTPNSQSSLDRLNNLTHQTATSCHFTQL
jgi:hypothetical protein